MTNGSFKIVLFRHKGVFLRFEKVCSVGYIQKESRLKEVGAMNLSPAYLAPFTAPHDPLPGNIVHVAVKFTPKYNAKPLSSSLY